jgi:predicted Fe-S protein YdhL (DUF1289 family)
MVNQRIVLNILALLIVGCALVNVTNELELAQWTSEEQVSKLLELPSPDDTSSSSLLSSDARKLNVGETLSLDELGPIIVNADGSLRRIANWDSLTESEQQSTYRQIAARNKKRIAALQQKRRSEEEASEKEGSTNQDEDIGSNEL